jgi:hypothetical protein
MESTVRFHWKIDLRSSHYALTLARFRP